MKLPLQPAGFLIAALTLAGCAGGTDQADLSPYADPLAILPNGNVVGVTPTILTAEFGQPALLRVDGPAQVWLYHSATCGLNLILYPDNTGTPRVKEAVPDNGNAAACMASIRRSVTAAALESTPAS
jgi:hypothetical protein